MYCSMVSSFVRIFIVCATNSYWRDTFSNFILFVPPQRCKTGRWSTLQASVFLHSTAIGNAKSSTVAGIGVAAANPFLIPLMAGIGIAAVGTPWLLLKMANDKWTEATMSLNDQFWMQAKPEVFVDCIEKWSKLGWLHCVDSDTLLMLLSDL